MKRILIIDDEQGIRDVYSRLFREEGFEVCTAGNAIEATRILIRENFDLVLLDIRMPNVDGKEIYEIVRICNPRIKVIVSSVYSVEEQIKSILGAWDYHDKAQGVDILIAKVKEALEGNRAH